MEDKSPQGRKWQLTINNPLDHGFSRDTIIGQLQTIGGNIYYCLCDEQGENETHHFHIFVYRPSAILFRQLKDLFPPAHIERCVGTCVENRAYILKDGDKFNKDEAGNYEYIDSNGLLHTGGSLQGAFSALSSPLLSLNLDHNRRGGRSQSLSQSLTDSVSFSQRCM